MSIERKPSLFPRARVRGFPVASRAGRRAAGERECSLAGEPLATREECRPRPAVSPCPLADRAHGFVRVFCEQMCVCVDVYEPA